MQDKNEKAAGGGSAVTRGLASMDIDICPPWWPWPWPGPRRFGPHPDPWRELPTDPVPWQKLPTGAQVSLRMFRALTVYNMAFQYDDKRAQADMQQLALKQLEQLTGELRQASNG